MLSELNDIKQQRDFFLDKLSASTIKNSEIVQSNINMRSIKAKARLDVMQLEQDALRLNESLLAAERMVNTLQSRSLELEEQIKKYQSE